MKKANFNSEYYTTIPEFMQAVLEDTLERAGEESLTKYSIKKVLHDLPC